MAQDKGKTTRSKSGSSAIYQQVSNLSPPQALTQQRINDITQHLRVSDFGIPATRISPVNQVASQVLPDAPRLDYRHSYGRDDTAEITLRVTGDLARSLVQEQENARKRSQESTRNDPSSLAEYRTLLSAVAELMDEAGIEDGEGLTEIDRLNVMVERYIELDTADRDA